MFQVSEIAIFVVSRVIPIDHRSTGVQNIFEKWFTEKERHKCKRKQGHEWWGDNKRDEWMMGEAAELAISSRWLIHEYG